MARLHKPKAGFWIRTWVVILFPVTSLFFKLRWRHLDRVPAPQQGGVIIAINHLSHADTVLMARLVWSSGRVPRFMIKAGVFGALISGLACFLCLRVTGGAQGVGVATTRTVVLTIVALILVDLLFTSFFYYYGW